MNDPKNTRITPVENSKYVHNSNEKIFQVPGGPVTVKPGETVEIVVSSTEGFKVCFPFEGHFDSQVYEAEMDPAWALGEMKATDGGDSQTQGNEIWGVRMKRISEAGAFPNHIFPYCVYSMDHKNFAVGVNSPPKMNLDP